MMNLRINYSLRLASMLLLLALAGCAVRSGEYPEQELPAAWQYAGDEVAAGWPDKTWWALFGSEELNQLIAQAEKNSPTLEAAAQQLLQAEYQARIAGASLLPSADASLSAGRGGNIEGGGHSESYSLSLGAGYEVDFWGKNRAARLAALESYKASQYELETVRLTLNASIVSHYLQLLSLQQRVATAEKNLALAEEVLALVERRASAGAVSQLDLVRQRALVLRQRNTFLPLKQQEREARAALAVLLGELPQTFAIQGGDILSLQVPAVVGGVASELLLRRPDLQAAEASLKVVELDVVQARAALYPSLTLRGSLGTSSDEFSDLLNGDWLYNLGASLTQPLFQGGRLRLQKKVAEARLQAALANYRNTILTAFSEVDNGLANIQSLNAQAALQHEELEQARETFRLADIRYREGADDLMTLLDAQQSLYAAEESVNSMVLGQLQAVVTLYRLLGGGWQLPEQQE